MVRQIARVAISADPDFIGVVFAGQTSCFKAIADLDAFDRIDAHHGRRQILIELAVDRRAKGCWNAFGHHFDNGPARRPSHTHAIQVVSPRLHACSIWAEEGVGIDRGPIPARTINLMRPHLDEARPDRHAFEDLAGDSPRRHPACGFTRRGTAAAAIVANAVLFPVGDVGVAWPELVFDIAVVFRLLVDVLDLECDGRAGGHLDASVVLEHAGEDLDGIGLAPLSCIARLARPTFVEKDLYVRFGQCQARWAPIHDAANRWPVALAPGGDAKQVAERIM